MSNVQHAWRVIIPRVRLYVCRHCAPETKSDSTYTLPCIFSSEWKQVRSKNFYPSVQSEPGPLRHARYPLRAATGGRLTLANWLEFVEGTIYFRKEIVLSCQLVWFWRYRFFNFNFKSCHFSGVLTRGGGRGEGGRRGEVQYTYFIVEVVCTCTDDLNVINYYKRIINHVVFIEFKQSLTL